MKTFGGVCHDLMRTVEDGKKVWIPFPSSDVPFKLFLPHSWKWKTGLWKMSLVSKMATFDFHDCWRKSIHLASTTQKPVAVAATAANWDVCAFEMVKGCKGGHQKSI